MSIFLKPLSRELLTCGSSSVSSDASDPGPSAAMESGVHARGVSAKGEVCVCSFEAPSGWATRPEAGAVSTSTVPSAGPVGATGLGGVPACWAVREAAAANFGSPRPRAVRCGRDEEGIELPCAEAFSDATALNPCGCTGTANSAAGSGGFTIVSDPMDSGLVTTRRSFLVPRPARSKNRLLLTTCHSRSLSPCQLASPA